MKTKLKYICLSAAAGLTLSLSSCSDFMDLTPEDQYDEATVWSDADLAKTVVNDVYSYVCDIAQEVNPDAWTDDAFFTHVYGCRDINEATVSPSNLGAYDRDDCPFKWSKQYKGIYRANLVLANIDNVPEKTGVDLNILKGETYFLRAYIYTELLRGFGGVPIVDKVYSIEEASALNLPRANVADVMDFILKDIEQATNLLPEQQIGVNLGRATKGAAKALKARLLLHVASPLFADRTVNKLECNQYTGDRQALYQQALDAAKDVINDSNYSLIDCNAGTIKEIAEKFHNIIITNNEETIWSKQYVNKDLNADNWVRNRVALLHGPNGYHNWAGTAPTHDLVMAFETEEGKTYWFDGDSYWRVMVFIPRAKTYETVNPEYSNYAGEAFGNFQAMLADIPETLGETIPDFHNMEFRLKQLREAVAKDAAGRVAEVKYYLDEIEKRADEMCKAERLYREGKLPKRVCHCDTKVNNMMFDEDGKVLCVIDLDTVMPSFIFSDYGDFLRTGANTGDEDDKDLERVNFNMEIFKAFTKGYLKGAKSFLTQIEIENLPYAAALFPYMQCVRFLADYINGDTYYKIKYPEHNLVRTKAQFKLLQSVEANTPEMIAFINECLLN